MAESSSPSSPQDQLALLAQPTAASVASRRLPPPCWSHDETVALIDAYRDKWYSLRRGNLRANHWQEVADAVAALCPLLPGNPTKTSVQCRHKMEKLRKRYRAELQRASSNPKGHRFNSSWVHFKRMESMEKGLAATALAPDLSPEDDDDDQDEDEDLYQSVKRGVIRQNRSVDMSIGNGSGGKGGFRIRLPASSSDPPPQAKIYTNPNDSPDFASTRPLRDGHPEKWCFDKRSGGGGCSVKVAGNKREGEPVVEIVAAIKALGDGFVRMERMKMEMAREVEAMRMEMEMKRTEMILESQQRIVEAFGKAFSEKRSKKAKRVPTPES